jgi:hypothetical protein
MTGGPSRIDSELRAAWRLVPSWASDGHSQEMLG